jgi:hypothetical protein
MPSHPTTPAPVIAPPAVFVARCDSCQIAVDPAKVGAWRRVVRNGAIVCCCPACADA